MNEADGGERGEAGRPEAGAGQHGRREHSRADPGQAKQSQPEPVQAEPGQAKQGQPEQVQPEQVQPEQVQPEPGSVEPGSVEPGQAAPHQQESLAALLGGRRGALDASLPPVAFVLAWLVSGQSIPWAAAGAIATGSVVAALRLARGQKLGAVVLSLAAVVAAAAIALYTGRAEDFFLLQLLANAASALIWTASILLRWPLLGLVVGGVLGQRTRWRRDPELVRAYALASWVWVGQYLVRVVVFGTLWLGGYVVALGTARAALTWPLVAACIAVSGWLLHRALPAGHPGIRHPREQN